VTSQTQFTPRNKQNLIGVMMARCDGERLGELVFLQLPKQEVIQGPLQVEALINQDQNISKDLTLWNQQGSQVLRSQMLTLPIDQTFLYVAPIYIQAAQARMPQLKKVALVRGSTLIYADTYEQALKLDPEVFEHRSTQGVLLQERSVEERAKFHYYLAKTYAKAGAVERALIYIRKAIEEGFKEKKKFEEDPEFSELRELPEFKQLMAMEARVL